MFITYTNPYDNKQIVARDNQAWFSKLNNSTIPVKCDSDEHFRFCDKCLSALEEDSDLDSVFIECSETFEGTEHVLSTMDYIFDIVVKGGGSYAYMWFGPTEENRVNLSKIGDIHTFIDTTHKNPIFTDHPQMFTITTEKQATITYKAGRFSDKNRTYVDRYTANKIDGRYIFTNWFGIDCFSLPIGDVKHEKFESPFSYEINPINKCIIHV